MKLFTRKDEYSVDLSWYEEDLNKIWAYINKKGTPHFKKDFLSYLWREYSDEVWAAGFIDVNQDTLEGFINWLEYYSI